MALGSIVIDLLLKTGSFSSDTQRAAKDLEKLKKEAYATGKAIGDSIKNIAAAVGIGLSANAFVGLIRGSIDAADHLNDLSKKTGIAVDTLGGMGFAAGQAGGDLESVSAAAGKLNKTLAAAAAGNKEASDLFKVLGISVTDAAGATKSADVVMAEIADRFSEWEDGPEKAAIALKGFGKAGADIIPLLNDGGRALRENIEYYKRYAGVTADTAKQADDFNDTLGKLKLISGAFGRQLAADLLPALQNVADEILSAKESGEGFKTTATGVVDILKGMVTVGAFVVTTFRDMGREIGQLAAKVGVVIELADDINKKKSLLSKTGAFAFGASLVTDAAPKIKAIGDAAREDAEKSTKALDDFYKALNGQGKNASAAFSDARFEAGRPKPKKRAPGLPDSGKQSEAAAEAMKKYEGEIKAEQDFAKQQKATFDYANRLLDSSFDEGLTSLRDYFAQQQVIRDAGLKSALQAIDAEIALRKQESKDPRLNAAQKIDADNKMKEAAQKRSEITVEAARENVLAYTGEAKVFKQFAEQMVDLQAQVAEGAGDTRLADSLRMQRQIAEAQRTVNALGADPAIVDKLREQLQTKSDLARLDQDSQLLTRQLAVDEDKLATTRLKGDIGELDQLAAVGAARRKAIPELEAIVAAQEAVAAASGNRALILNAEEARGALERLKAEIDPLAQKFNELFSDSFADAFYDFASGAKSAKDAFKSFANSVVSEILRMGSKELARNVFGSATSSGGGGGWLSALIGAAGSYFGSSSGSGATFNTTGGSNLGSAGGLGAGRAIGGPTLPNTMHPTGEVGPEVYRDSRGRNYLLEGNRGGWVDPSPRWGGGGRNINVTTNVTVPGNTDRRTGSQIGAEVARKLAVASVRNN